MSIRTYLTTLVAVLSVANGHMTMNTPTPYGLSSLNSSPLAADGSDFPCKLREHGYDVENANNKMAVGDSQTLSFKGSAVHGGGSCQVSLTSDKQPSKSTKWMVIHSILGGCPSGVSGNLPENPNGDGASTFQYTIPSGIAPGEYTLAWTWFNKIGNREMYMNCAPITVTGAKRKRSPVPQPRLKFTKRADFPDMFVANINGVSNGCATLENFDVIFPDPGNSVQTVQGSQFTGPVSCQNLPAATGAASPNAASPAAPSPTAAAEGSSGSGASAPASGASSLASSPTVVPGVFASGASSPSGASPAVSSVAAEPSAAAPAPVATSAPASPAPVSSGTSGAQSGACTDEGAWNCIDGSSFQRCASGAWSAAMQVAAGTKCTPGISDTLTMSKRALRFSQPHVRRSHNAWGH